MSFWYAGGQSCCAAAVRNSRALAAHLAPSYSPTSCRSTHGGEPRQRLLAPPAHRAVVPEQQGHQPPEPVAVEGHLELLRVLQQLQQQLAGRGAVPQEGCGQVEGADGPLRLRLPRRKGQVEHVPRLVVRPRRHGAGRRGDGLQADPVASAGPCHGERITQMGEQRAVPDGEGQARFGARSPCCCRCWGWGWCWCCRLRLGLGRLSLAAATTASQVALQLHLVAHHLEGVAVGRGECHEARQDLESLGQRLVRLVVGLSTCGI